MKKRIFALALALALTLALAPPASAAETLGAGARYVGGAYDELGAPSGGFCAFGSGGLWGYLDISDGSVAVEPRYAAALEFSGGYAAVADASGRYGFINRFGALVCDFEWQPAGEFFGFSEGFCPVRDPESGLCGFVGTNFALAVACRYLEVRNFSGGYAAVRDETGWTFVDANARELTAERYLETSGFDGGVAAVRSSGGWGVINSAGVPLCACEWRSAAVGEGLASLTGEGECAVVSADGTLRRYAGYESLGAYSGGLAAVRVRGKWGFADRSGEVAIAAVYDEVGDFHGAFASAARAGTPGVVNRDGYYTPLGGASAVGEYSGAALPVYFTSWALFRADTSYAATGLSGVIGCEGDRFAVRTGGGCRLLSAKGENLTSAQFPRASAWAVGELREAGALGLLDPLESLADWSADITRERFCELALRFYELVGGETPAPDYSLFTDTQNPSVLKAAAVGLVNGDGDGRFRPNDTLTREEAALVLMRLCALVGFEPAEVADGEPADAAAISPWAADAVVALYRAQVFLGDELGRFCPGGHLSAEAAALTLYRLLHAPGELG